MAKAFDVSKFRRDITKSIDGLSIGFNDPTDWISTGNFALNYLISGDFNKGIPLGKVTVFAGESGAGKSYICSGVSAPVTNVPSVTQCADMHKIAFGLGMGFAKSRSAFV